jgi:hypothetical protein
VSNRVGIVELLGKMFAVKESHLITEFQNVAEEFFSRMGDKETKVRSVAVRYTKDIIINHPQAMKLVEGTY